MAGFHWSDYLVFTISLMISLAIGVYYAVSSRKSSTTEGYLMGNRQMHMIPVTLSLVRNCIGRFIVENVEMCKIRGRNLKKSSMTLLLQSVAME